MKQVFVSLRRVATSTSFVTRCFPVILPLVCGQWVSVSHITPGHCLVLFGINTMQGREAKHQKLAQYAEFSLPKERWQNVFLHEHMSLIWMRKQNPHLVKYQKSKDSYIPTRSYSAGVCFCGLYYQSPRHM